MEGVTRKCVCLDTKHTHIPVTSAKHPTVEKVLLTNVQLFNELVVNFFVAFA